jgi:pimeloyl-ACP methyl ester carboxylesterase
MRRLSYVFVCLAAASGAFLAPTAAPAEPRLERRPVAFTVQNPHMSGDQRIAGYRYEPACKPPTVVLLQHGLSYTKAAWDFPGYSVAKPLAEAGYAVVAIDRLGYGESKLESGYDVSFEAYGAMTRQMIDQLRAEGFRHVVLGGHSAGAGITEFTAGMFGGVDAIMAFAWHHRPSDRLAQEFMTGDTTRAAQDDYEYFLGTPQHRSEMFFTKDADPAVVAADRDAAVLTPSGEILTIGKQPSRAAVGRVDVPVFLQFPTDDLLFEPQYASLHASEFVSSPSVTVDLVPGGHTHMLHPSGRQATANIVSWLRTLPEAPACD